MFASVQTLVNSVASRWKWFVCGMPCRLRIHGTFMNIFRALRLTDYSYN